MKKLLMLLVVMFTVIGAHAQFEKNTSYISTSVTGLGLSYSGNEKFTMGMGVTGGYFIEDSWMLYGNVNYDHTRYSDNVSMGIGGRYYFTQNGVYMGCGLQYEHITKSINNLQLCPEVGYSFFINRFMTLEPAVYYHMSLNDFSNGSKVGLKFGLGFYF